MSCSSCSTTSASGPQARSAARARRLPPSAWRPAVWPSPGSTPQPCAHPPGPHCSPAATTTVWEWGRFPTSPPRPRATARCGPRRRRRWPKPCASTATPRPSSASATRSRCGRTARWDPSTSGRRVVGSSTSTGSSAAAPTSGIPGLYEGTNPVEPARTPEEGYHLTEDLADRAIAWIRQQKSLAPDKPFFAYFAPGATHAPHHVPKRVDRPLPGPVRRRLGRPPSADFRPPEGAGGHPGRCRTDRPTGRDPGLGRDRRRPEAGAGPSDGGVRRLPLPHRPPRRPADRRSRGARDPGRHPGPVSDRGQRSQCRGNPPRHVQRAARLQPEHGPRDHRVPQGPHRRLRVACGQQPLRRRLGPCHLHPLPVDQAGGLPLRRDAQRDGGPLARRVRGPG